MLTDELREARRKLQREIVLRHMIECPPDLKCDGMSNVIMSPSSWRGHGVDISEMMSGRYAELEIAERAMLTPPPPGYIGVHCGALARWRVVRDRKTWFACDDHAAAQRITGGVDQLVRMGPCAFVAIEVYVARNVLGFEDYE